MQSTTVNNCSGGGLVHPQWLQWCKTYFKVLKKRQVPGPGWHSATPFKGIGRGNQLPPNIFQTSLDSGRLPKDWLTANVSPIYKGGQRVDSKNFRPVILTSTCLKVIERIIKVSLTRFEDSKQIMSTRQHGFRHGRSCLQNLLNSHEQ